jgi:hypothetical protein
MMHAAACSDVGFERWNRDRSGRKSPVRWVYQSANLGGAAGRTAPSHPPSVPEHGDRPQRDIAHQSDLGHIPSVGERFGNERKLTPA